MVDKNHAGIVKKTLIASPIRKRLGDCESVPFKKLIVNNLEEVMASLETQETNNNNPLKVVIVGEVKSGKSSLLNALISEEVSEVDVLESTSKIIEVVYGKENNKKNINELCKISLDLEYLKKINIVDTPGLKSITIDNEQRTMNYIQNADLILFVLDATHLGQDDVYEALELISTYNKPIIGVVNKCDLLQDSYEKILEYIQDEYELFLEDIFMISSYLEFQVKRSKNVIAGSTDLVVYENEYLNENFNRLLEYIDKIYINSEEIKSESTRLSLLGIIQKDIVNHYEYNKSVSMLLEELKKHEKLLENKFDYIISRMEFEINDWINRSFLEEEISKIKSDLDNAKLYINEHYINELVNKRKVEFDKMFYKEWSECLKEVNDEIDGNIRKYMENINYRNELIDAPSFVLEYEKMNLNEMLVTVGTGAILGATSGTVISMYAASIGTSATTLTMGSALMTYCPPLLIAGTVTGAIGKLVFDKIQNDKKNKDILNDIDAFREKIKYDILDRLKDGYITSSKDIVVTTTEIYKNSKGIYINKYEIENILTDITEYINKLNVLLK